MDLCTSCRRAGLNFVRDNSLLGVRPCDTVPGGSFTVEPLDKVQDARRQQKYRAGQHQPCSICKYRSLHLSRCPTLIKHTRSSKIKMQGMFPRPTSLRFAPWLGFSAVTLVKRAKSRALCDLDNNTRFLEENCGQNSIQVFGLFRDFGEPSRRVKRRKVEAKIENKKEARLRPFV